MSKKIQKEKELKPWDRRPWPTNGDKNVGKVHEAIGRTLSMWEQYEGVLSLLFAHFVGSRETGAARRAYCAVRTFEGRWEMLRAVSEAYFTANPDVDLQEKFKKEWKPAKEYASRRNDIAHGVVESFHPLPLPFHTYTAETLTWALYPSYANFKDRDANNMPEYCYTSLELDYFYEQFYKLIQPIGVICGMLMKKEEEKTLLKKSQQLDHK